ncbi:hypothetical protein HPB48_011523 [Haemaphysalis longicornis]|uniref:ZSWIM1/3 RNaseH-like domain-containing protein n=1 Tax=Haemaphysalis longicornis TaxID=44386 RepID=A0A9J6G3P7_HAELO|nr:hypothetical protein HPB48_011523 [Haemaphysalis longicornis]
MFVPRLFAAHVQGPRFGSMPLHIVEKLGPGPVGTLHEWALNALTMWGLSGLTFKKDCEFSIYVAANKEGSHLEVRSVNLEHNHPVAPQLFQQLPQQRRLPPDLKAKARHLLKLRANKMLVREQIQKESGHAVSLKDLSNISAEGKHAEPRNNLPEVVRILQEKHKAAVRLLTDEDNELQALYFQDEHMKASFEAYLELIFVDATYKLLDTRMA